MPAVPNDDLFADYNDTRRNKFLTALDNFIKDAEKALREHNQLTASKMWRKHLGNRFPEGEDKEDDSKSYHTAAIAAWAVRSNPWASE